MTPRDLKPGISGVSVYVPRPRVSLERWCEWTGAPWNKIEAVVGRSFRICPPEENAYTMAASAVMRLIDAYAIDPQRVGFLALGTESSTDNAAGAVIVRGMVDQALRESGRPPLARACEVPELKHACLGGVYATKAAARWLALEGRGKQAIVVSADVAEYARGSTGEQTQGAGAVAFLLESTPRLLELDLHAAGSASAYRGIDFRKPTRRHFMGGYDETGRGRDFPVFNGRYSTTCYLDAVNHALDDHFDKTGAKRGEAFAELSAIFFHRPYHHLPIAAFAAALVWGMARDGEDGALAALCEEAGVDVALVREQIASSPNLFDLATGEGPDIDPFAEANKVVKAFRRRPEFQALVESKLSLGGDHVRELGNLYTASLPAWLAAGLDEAARESLDLDDARMLLIGYGSGDAAEVIPGRIVPGWREAAARIDLAGSLSGALDLDREAYERLHDGEGSLDDGSAAPGSFSIGRIGEANEAKFQDIGVEYYRWHRSA